VRRYRLDMYAPPAALVEGVRHRVVDRIGRADIDERASVDVTQSAPPQDDILGGAQTVSPVCHRRTPRVSLPSRFQSPTWASSVVNPNVKVMSATPPRNEFFR
jgi:hypothetical protein